MKRLPIAAFLIIASSLSADWDGLHGKRLEESSAYQKALSQLKQAELKVHQLDRFYLPYLELGTSGQSRLVLRDATFLPSVLAADLRFENVLGADLTLELPLELGGETAASIGNPSLSLSRRLFEESRAQQLKAEAALIRAQDSLRRAAADVRTELAADILDAYHATRILDSSRRDLEVLESVRSATRDEKDVRTLDRRILQARRSILQATSQFQSLDAEVRTDVDGLYAEATERIEGWLRQMPDSTLAAPESPELAAKQLDLAAAEQEASLSFLPYLPNPVLSAGLQYDLEKGEFSWSASLAFSAGLLDRGERAVASYLRREGPKILRIELYSLRRARDRAIASGWSSLEVLDLDRKIQALDLEDARDEVARLKALFDGGFATREELLVGEIEFSLEELDAVKVHHDYLKQQLKILATYGIDQSVDG